MMLKKREVEYYKLSFILLTLISSIGILLSTNLIQADETVDDPVILSLEPKLIEVPFINMEQGSFLILIELKIYNVQNLKEFHINFTYDSRIVKFYRGKIDHSFYTETGGWVGDELNGRLEKAYSGSGTMFTYSFIVRQIGSTKIEIFDTELIDSFGNPILYKSSNCTVKVLSKSDWIDGEYAKLQNKYDKLLSNYIDLNITHHKLLSELQDKYDTVLSNYINLLSEYINLNTTYRNLLSEYNKLENMTSTLQNQVSKLEDEMDILKAQLGNLKSEKSTLEEQVLNLEASLSSWKMYTVAALAIGLTIGAATIYITKRK